MFLLNGRRISGYREIWTLPPEALERTEVLSEQDAARFGFAPTVRVVNFVLKPQFRAIVVDQGPAPPPMAAAAPSGWSWDRPASRATAARCCRSTTTGRTACAPRSGPICPTATARSTGSAISARSAGAVSTRRSMRWPDVR
ncbi:hypothetical protein ACVOMT_06585 [Sphingomonas panni]